MSETHAEPDAPAVTVPKGGKTPAGKLRRVRMIQDDDPSSIMVKGIRRRLFFVSGHPRSGTTWLGAVLKRHPRVFCDGEFSFQLLKNGFDAFRGKPSKRGAREPVNSLAERCFQDTIRLVLSTCVPRKPEAEWFGDRTPRRLVVMLPGAMHFVIYRDGRDVMVSAALMYINGEWGPYADHKHDKQLATARARFAEDPEFFKQNPGQLLACEGFVRQMAKRWAWQVMQDRRVAAKIRAGELPARVHEVHYERLHADPEAERARMYEFLGLDPCEAEPLTAESRTLPGLGQDDHTSDKRKGEVGDWRHYFTASATKWFDEEAGHAMRALGYADGDA